MRYLSIIRLDPSKAPAGGPSPELMERMGALMKEMTEAGVMLDTAGLKQEGVRIVGDHGRITVLDGPYTEAKEVIGGYCLVNTRTQEEAVEWARRFVEIHGEEWELMCEVRPLDEAPEQ
ncbi:transcriptional regulator [Mangrovactinospora gilvigrisea]|uniref:Transcriptional regulator n=1 Tax=Mangrovactinospora gilvigrisea TaxID=1428644 RepID=A0A1J7BH32_9ACTN|nr:YciI family protein [Mangrovactinospora gilvigrisea]OIV37966.1 transcriptional regulator [Mangrovactinospora gilvigrisea]